MCVTLLSNGNDGRGVATRCARRILLQHLLPHSSPNVAGSGLVSVAVNVHILRHRRRWCAGVVLWNGSISLLRTLVPREVKHQVCSYLLRLFFEHLLRDRPAYAPEARLPN